MTLSFTSGTIAGIRVKGEMSTHGDQGKWGNWVTTAK